MSDTAGTKKLIEEFEEKRRRQLGDVAQTEQTIDQLLEHIGDPPRYAGKGATQRQENHSTPSTTIKRGQFYGQPLATAIGQFLAPRDRTPATPQEILEALTVGGFDFDALGWNEQNRTRSLAMSMSKNSTKFHRLPDGSWGLAEWYPNVRG